jgi:hypothetical protein
VMNKLKTFTEVRHRISEKQNSNISSAIQELLSRNLLFCITPRARTGKLYGLTNKGKKYRKILFREKKPRYVQPSNINWKHYGWVVCGRQRRAILKGFSTEMPLKYIKERAKQYNPRISRMNCHDILELFVKKGIAKKIFYKNHVNFALTKKGERIRNQLLEP